MTSALSSVRFGCSAAATPALKFGFAGGLSSQESASSPPPPASSGRHTLQAKPPAAQAAPVIPTASSAPKAETTRSSEPKFVLAGMSNAFSRPLEISAAQMAQMQAAWAAQQAQLTAATQQALQQAYAKHQEGAQRESLGYRLQHDGGMPPEIANGSGIFRYNPFVVSPMEAYGNLRADQQAGVHVPLLAPEFRNPEFYRQYYLVGKSNAASV